MLSALKVWLRTKRASGDSAFSLRWPNHRDWHQIVQDRNFVKRNYEFWHAFGIGDVGLVEEEECHLSPVRVIHGLTRAGVVQGSMSGSG